MPDTEKKKRPYSQAQNKATQKYIKAHYEEFIVRFPLGSKAKIKAHVEKRGESMNGFIKRAIDEAIERDNEK